MGIHSALKSMGEKLSDLLAAAAFAEEGEADSARELLQEKADLSAKEKEEACCRTLNLEHADNLPAR